MQSRILEKMLKKKGIWLLLLLPFAVFTWVMIVVATDERHHLPLYQSQGGYLYDKQEFEQVLNEFPELSWLSGANQAFDKLATASCSVVKYFGEDSTPFDCAIKGIRSIELFIHGEYPDYLEFVSVMPKESRLTWEQFLTAQQQARSIVNHSSLTKEELIEALKVSLIVSEMKHSKTLRARAWVYEIDQRDEIDLLNCVIETHPEIFPSYAKMTLPQKEWVHNLLTSISLDRLFYFTSTYKMLGEFERLGLVTCDRNLFESILFLHQCRISGRDLINDQVGSRGLNAKIFEDRQLFRKAAFLSVEQSVNEAYQYYLEQRARWFGLNTATPLDRALTFLGAMLNCYSEVEGHVLKEAFFLLPPNDVSFLVSEAEYLSTEGDDTYKYLTPVLSNLRRNNRLGHSSTERLSNTIALGFPFISKIIFLGQAQQLKVPVVLDFAEIAKLARGDPDWLTRPCLINQDDGTVVVKKL